MSALLVSLLNNVLTFLANAKEPVKQLFVQPFITVVVIGIFYAGWHVVLEGSVQEGLRAAFVNDRAVRELRDRQSQALVMQAELRLVAKSDALINQMLASALSKAPTAARVNVAVIHNGIIGITGIGLLRFDTLNTVAAPGRAPGDPVRSGPLNEWNEYIAALLAGKCAIVEVNKMRNGLARGRMENLQVTTFLACPMTDVRGQTLGALFYHWDQGSQVPEGADMDALVADAHTVAGQLASAFALRSPWALRDSDCCR